MTAFPVPVLPAGALRRSWLAAAANETGEAVTYRALLAQLAPQKLAQVRNHTALGYYGALVAHVGAFFPVYDWYLDEADVDGEVYIPDGIPVATHGVHVFECESMALALCALDLFDTHDPNNFYAFRDQRKWLLSWWKTPEIRRPLSPRQSAGLRAPWCFAGDLAEYAAHRTGNPWLDISPEEMDEGGYANPAWTLGEIQHLATMWKRARPLYDNVHALANYVDDDWRARLPLLHRLLCKDAAALRELRRRPRRRAAPRGER